ncbi:MAG: hypothetical protein Q4E33_02925 [Erysipelotrichaceae bacterium]|nr:hypothetical protein [Erysipelotrichaceae bacterium]
MKYSFKKINIEAPFPTTQCGHSCQVEELFDYHDHLYCRCLGLKDDNNWIIHLSMDLLGFDYNHRNMLQDKLRQYYHDDNLHLITSTTHTHYANSVRTNKYVDYLCELLEKEIVKMEYVDKENVTTTYQRFHSTAVGKSRISGYETNNEYLCLIRFYESDNNFLNIVYNNCHPTILQANVPYFSSEYPGYVLKKLEDTYAGVDFTFLQGAAGDISSRFVRDGQDYEALSKLGDNLTKEVIDLMNVEVSKVPFSISYNEIIVPYVHEFTPIDLSNLPENLSDREKETIEIGSKERVKLKAAAEKDPNRLAKCGLVVGLNIGSVKLVFFSNEIFSEYMNYLDLDKEILVSYSNGYGPYVLPIDFNHVTYEMFTDTLTRDTKVKIVEALKNI